MIGFGLHRYRDCNGILHVWRGFYAGGPTIINCTRAAAVAGLLAIAPPGHEHARGTAPIGASALIPSQGSRAVEGVEYGAGGYAVPGMGWDDLSPLGSAASAHHPASLNAASPKTHSGAVWANLISHENEQVRPGLPTEFAPMVPATFVPTTTLPAITPLPPTLTTPDQPTPVPEPASLAVLGVALIALSRIRRRTP